MRILIYQSASIDANEITDKGYINQRLARSGAGPTSSGYSAASRMMIDYDLSR
jgi:hypothetical protein